MVYASIYVNQMLNNSIMLIDNFCKRSNAYKSLIIKSLYYCK